jgi:hypothetical protein
MRTPVKTLVALRRQDDGTWWESTKIMHLRIWAPTSCPNSMTRDEVLAHLRVRHPGIIVTQGAYRD